MNETTLYEIHCPETGEIETTSSEDRAFDLCYSMSEEETKYVCIRDTFGNVIGEYGDVMDAVDRGLV
tara:strand:+ start:1115 stop:1315 length:201 start_codon:yes stop_codon:yes gene_type:complete